MREEPVVLRTDDAAVEREVRRLAELAEVDLVVVGGGETAPPGPVTLDHVRPGTVAVRAARDDTQAARLLSLPGQAGALLDLLVTAGRPARARVLGVVGLVGGVGATSLAATVARAAVARGVATALADLDPGGGGLDAVLGMEHDGGLRWADLTAERGAPVPSRLAAALPSWHLVTVLSGDRRGGVDPGSAAVRSGIRALAQAHDLVVLDLPRQVLAPGGDGWTGQCDDVVAVVPGGARGGTAAAAAGRALAGTRVWLVVRAPGPEAPLLAEVVGAAGALVLRTERGLAAGAERGVPPGESRRGPLRATANALLAGLGLP